MSFFCSNIPGIHPYTGATPPTRTTHHAYVLHSQLYVAQSTGLLITKGAHIENKKAKTSASLWHH